MYPYRNAYDLVDLPRHHPLLAGDPGSPVPFSALWDMEYEAEQWALQLSWERFENCPPRHWFDGQAA